MQKFILSTAFCFIINLVSAQDHWLVTTKLDTVRGKMYIIAGGQYKADEVKVKIGKEKSIYKSYHIRHLFLDEESSFETLKIDGRYQFAKIDAKGKYFSHYYYLDPSSTSVNNFTQRLLVRYSGEQFKIGNLSPKAKVAEYFDECPPVSDKIANGTYSKFDMDKIFSAYDLCMDQNERYLAQKLPVKSPSDDMVTFITQLKAKDLYSTDLANMLEDISQKLNSQQAIPKYLQDAVIADLGEEEELKTQFLEIMK